MAAVDLSIHLDDPDTAYELGDTVTGTLKLSSLEEAELRGLRVGPEFVVEGPAKRSTGGQPELMELMPGGGSLRAGELREVDFEFQLPLEPPPYHGENFRIRWQVVARADLPMSLDAKAEPVPLETRVGAASREGEYTGHAMSGSAPELEMQERAEDVGRNLRRGCGKKLMLGCTIPLVVLGVSILGVFIPAVSHDPDNWIGVGIGVAVLLPTILIWLWIRRTSESAQIGHVEISLDPQVARPGETIHCRANLTPARDMTVASVRVSLVTREEFAVRKKHRHGRSSVGSSTTMRTRTLHTDERELGSGIRVAEGTPAEWEERFRLSDRVPYSVRTSSGSLQWLMRTVVEVEGAEPVVKETPLIVRP